MNREEAYLIAEKCTQVDGGGGYWGRLWDAIADEILNAYQRGLGDGKILKARIADLELRNAGLDTDLSWLPNKGAGLDGRRDK